MSMHIYIYIYIYVCVCVCVCHIKHSAANTEKLFVIRPLIQQGHGVAQLVEAPCYKWKVAGSIPDFSLT